MDPMKALIRLSALAAALVMTTACEEIDTSALQQIEDAAATVRASADEVNARSEQLRTAAEDPVGALRDAALGATLTRTATDQPGIYVVTDVTTGCQWLATYGPDDVATSMEPRTEVAEDGTTRQRCVSVAGLAVRETAEAG